jgi:hypothetical protein
VARAAVGLHVTKVWRDNPGHHQAGPDRGFPCKRKKMLLKLLIPVVGSAFLLMSGCLVQASTITFTPASNPAVPVSPAFGALVAGGALGTNYIAFGVDFTLGGVEGIFNDSPLAFGGVNGSGVVDLLSPVDGRIVVPGTTNQGLTDSFEAEAGFAANGTLLLTVYDIHGNVLATAFNGLPLGPNGRTTFAISEPTPIIAAFSITDPGADSYGVDDITLSTPIGVPEPASLSILAVSLLGMGAYRRFRR